MKDNARGTIYVMSPDIPSPTGGIKVLYRHVDILNAHGYRAFILHENVGFRCTWFENTTPVTYLPFVRPTDEDFVVIPEIFGPQMARIARGTPKVIYNQSGSLTFQGYPIDASGDETPYTNPEVVATFAISENVIDYVSFAFPEMRQFRMRWSIDQSAFSFVGPSHKKRQIAFMPRRRPEEALQVFNLLKFRGALDGFNVVPIHDMTAKQTADVMGQSLLFFSFGYPEGLPLPPAEAMSRGCIVIGYHGFGGKEYFLPDVCYPVEAGDVLSFAQTAEKVLDGVRRNEPHVTEKGRLASKLIKSQYSTENEVADVLSAWTELAGEPA